MQFKLTGFYANGLGVKADMVQSYLYLYLALAADHSNNAAKTNLAIIFESLTAAEKANYVSNIPELNYFS